MKKNKNDSNLIRTDTFLYKIKVFFTNLFSSHLNKKENSIDLNFSDNNMIVKPSKNETKSKFLEQLKVDGESQTQKLVRLLNNNTLHLEELTEEQKSDIILFLKEELSEKKFKLQNIKNKKLLNELNNNHDIDLILSRTSTDKKTNFIEYLKEEINIKKDKLKKLKLKASNI